MRSENSSVKFTSFPFSESLFDLLPLGIVFQDDDGSIIKANPSAESILGLSVDQMRGIKSIDPRWRAIHVDGSPFPGEDHPAMVALKTKMPVLNVLMGVFNPNRDDFAWISVSAFPILDFNDRTLQGVYAVFEDISLLKSAEHQKQEIETRFKSAFDAMSEGMALHQVVYDDQGSAKDYLIVDVNPAFEIQTGMSKESVIGKLASHAYGTGEAPFLDIFAKVARTQEPMHFEQYFQPMGKCFLINVFSQGKGQFGTVFEDITERKNSEEELRLMQFSIEHSPDAVYRMTPDGRFLYVNKMACQTLGYSADELLTMGVADIDPSQPLGVSPEMALATKIAGSARRESKHRTKDGRIIPVEILVSHFEHKGKEYHCSFVRDISERKQAEQALAASMHSLEEKELAKSRFLAAAGHDLRQPLSAAMLFIDALKFSKPNPEQKMIIERLDHAMSNFNVLLDTLLNVSKLDAGAITPIVTVTSLVEIFSWLEQSFSPMCAEKQLKLKFHLPLSSSLAVRTDIGLLKSILLNLVSNAIQYTPHGGILISARQRGESILIQVWDTGIGIQQENLEKIFDDFYQINNPQRDRTQGLGLGLSIAKRSLALFDGKISCHSQFGRGSVFGFSLPKYSIPSEQIYNSNSSASDEIESISQFVKGKRFVIVEDDALVSEALTKALTLMGGEVENYYDADKALQEINVEKTDCFIVDYMLPGDVDGINFLLRLHQKKHKPVCAVMMSGNTSTQFIQKTKFFNWPVVHKPVDIAQLIFQLSNQFAN